MPNADGIINLFARRKKMGENRRATHTAFFVWNVITHSLLSDVEMNCIIQIAEKGDAFCDAFVAPIMRSFG